MKEMKANVSSFPEEVYSDGIRLYGETSMDNCLAVLTHYLHNETLRKGLSKEEQDNVRILIEDWLNAKGGQNQGLHR